MSRKPDAEIVSRVESVGGWNPPSRPDISWLNYNLPVGTKLYALTDEEVKKLDAVGAEGRGEGKS